MFSVMDANGAKKIRPYGTGLSLTDPVGVTHGGTALTGAAQGDLLIADAANSVARLAKSSTLAQVLSLRSGDTVPSWRDQGTLFTPVDGAGYIPNPASREYNAPRILNANYLAGGWPASTAAFGRTVALSGGAQTDATDAVSTWARGTSGAVSGNSTSFAFDSTGFSSLWQFRHEGLFIARVRTGADITNVRLCVGVGGSITPTSDSPTGIINQLVAVRYSTSAGDTGWTGWVFDGNLPVNQTTAQIAAIAASTSYLIAIKIRAVSGSVDYAVDFSVNNVTATLTIPFSMLNATQINNLVAGVGVVTLAAAAKVVDCGALYLQTGHSTLLA